jgi:predicted CoA-binding protein
MRQRVIYYLKKLTACASELHEAETRGKHMQTTPDMYERLKIIQKYRNVAIVGVSADQYRPSHFVAIYLQAEGYNIIPINPRYAGQTLLGKRVYATLTEARDAGEQIEIVDVFRRSEDIPPIAEEAVRIGAQVLWVQLGLKSPEAREIANKAQIIYVEDRCIKMEHARFFGGLNTIGVNTGVVLSRKLA